MRKEWVAVCVATVVVVIWYSISIHHHLQVPSLNPAITNDTLAPQHPLRSASHPSTHQPSHTKGYDSTYLIKNVPASDSEHTTYQEHTLKERESIMHERLARVAEVCSKHPRKLMRFDLFGVFRSLTVDPVHHLVYCRNAKAGTTTWLSRMLTWSGISLKNTSPTNIHKVANLIFPTMGPDKMMKELQHSAITFTVARHPFDRLVSAYRNKIQGDKNYKTYLWPKMISKYRKRTTNKTEFDNPRPTFREFALFTSDEVLRCLERARPSCLQKVDVHWQPHHDRCAPCNIKYDVIVKVETKYEDEAYLRDLLGLSLPEPAEQNAAVGNSTSSLTKAFFATLSQSERQQVFEAYKFDFLMFDYTYNDGEYIHMEKDP